MKRNAILCLISMVCLGWFAIEAKAADAKPGAEVVKPRDLDTLNANQRLRMLSVNLGLSDDQKEKMRPIILEEVKAVRILKENDAIPLKERFAKEAQLREVCKAKVKPILTPEQFSKWESMMKRRAPKPNA